MRASSAPAFCLVVLGAAISAVKHKRDPCNFTHPVKAGNGFGMHVAFFARRVAAPELGGVEVVFHNFLNFVFTAVIACFNVNDCLFFIVLSYLCCYSVVQVLPPLVLFCMPVSDTLNL